MYSRLLILFFFIFLFQEIRASEHPINYNSNWEDQLREINFNLKKTTLPTKQAEILKSFRSKLLSEINSSKDMNSPNFEKKISVFNRMNALFLDKFQKTSCPSIKSRWELLKTSESDNKFEVQQIENWLNTICQ